MRLTDEYKDKPVSSVGNSCSLYRFWCVLDAGSMYLHVFSGARVAILGVAYCADGTNPCAILKKLALNGGT